MRWTFKRFAIWLAAFLFTSFGSMTLHGTPGVVFSVLQFAVAMILGWPVVKPFVCGILDVSISESVSTRKNFDSDEQLRQAQRNNK